MTFTRHFAVVAATLLALYALPLAAADKPRPKADPADPVERKPDASAKPSADAAGADTIEVLHPNDATAMKEHMGKEVAVEGTVSESTWSGSGKVMQVKFTEASTTKFMAVAFVKSRAAFDKAFGGDVAKALVGKRVRVIGTLTDYKGKPEIVIDKPWQIEILSEGSGEGGRGKPGEKPGWAKKE